MKTKTLCASALLFAPALLAFQPRATSIAFTVAEGTSNTKTFSNTMTMSLDDMQMLLNGNESPMMPQIDMTIESGLTITVSDDYVKMGDGAPAKLKRTYDSLEQTRNMEMEMDIMGQVQNQDTATGSESELVGESVLFTMSEGEYIPTFAEGEGDEKLLENLAEDLDLRGLLPDGEVDEGAEWKVDPVVLKDILVPGGDLKFIPEEADDGDMMGMDSEMGDFEDWFSEDIEGEVLATFKGMKETEDGTKVAIISITIELANAVDLTEKMQEGLENADLPPEAGDMEMNSMDIEMELEGEATLLWDIAAGRAHSFEMESELSLLVDMSMSVSAQGMDMEIDQSMEFSGSMTASASVE